MKTIVFDSPWQHEVRHAESGIVFQRGVPREVNDEVADLLLGSAPGTRPHPHFSEFAAKGNVAKDARPLNQTPEKPPASPELANAATTHSSG